MIELGKFTYHCNSKTHHGLMLNKAGLVSIFRLSYGVGERGKPFLFMHLFFIEFEGILLCTAFGLGSFFRFSFLFCCCSVVGWGLLRFFWVWGLWGVFFCFDLLFKFMASSVGIFFTQFNGRLCTGREERSQSTLQLLY